MAIVGLVLVFSEKFEFAKKTVPLDKESEITTSFSLTSLFSKQDCVSSSTRPCYDKKTGKKFILLETKGAEKSFAACLKSAALKESGELAANTPKCSAERYQYCYDGKSRTFLRKFEGQCIDSQPSSNVVNCPALPYLLFVGSVETDWNNYYSSPHIASLLQSKSGALYAAGYKLKSIPSEWGGSYYLPVPVVYKSTDSGRTWAGVELPYDATGYAYVRYIKEASDGSLYVTGTFLWKSSDGGLTWSIISDQFITSYSVISVSDVLQSKDGSILALVPRVFPEVYKSTDSGATWQFLFRIQLDLNFSTSYDFVEANDDSLIFTILNGDIYRYTNGILTKVLSTGPSNVIIPFLKARDGNIYFIADSSAGIADSYQSRLDRYLYSFMSSDNGITWTKTGALPYSNPTMQFGNLFEFSLIEDLDGTIWSTSFSPCWEMTLYKSADKTATWSSIATAPTYIASIMGLGHKRINALVGVNGKIYAAGEDSGGIFSTP